MSEGTLQFSYRAAHRTGTMETGAVRAESADAARELLFSRGLFPLEVRLERGRTAGRPRISTPELALGLRVMATLLESGLPVTRALAAMEDLVPPAWKAALPALRESVNQGNSLGAALTAAPVGFPPLVVGLVQAGEAGSGLAAAVERAAQLTEQAAETRRAVRAALAYPLILAAAGTGAMVLLVGFVLPRFAAVLADLGQGLPPTARTVLGAAELARLLRLERATIGTTVAVISIAFSLVRAVGLGLLIAAVFAGRPRVDVLDHFLRVDARELRGQLDRRLAGAARGAGAGLQAAGLPAAQHWNSAMPADDPGRSQPGTVCRGCTRGGSPECIAGSPPASACSTSAG